MMQANFILYGTQDCHLCEQAEQLCHSLAIDVEKQDIAFNNDLFATYGTRIPVIKSKSNAQELAWPFDAGQLQEFVACAH